jgi:D-3-phosphoglycerate dehydrogenase / 2-oxoglutarate reductase
MKIVVLDDYQDAFRTLSCFLRLAGNEVLVFHDAVKEPEALAARLGDAEAAVLIQQRSALPRAVVERLPGVRLVSQTGRNVGHIDLAACTERGIVVSAGGASSPNATAELAWGLILAALRQIPQEAERLKAGLWLGSLGRGVAGKTLGVYAFGRIGSLVAEVGRAFGMRVACWGRAGSTARARAAGFAVAESREAFFATADVLSLPVPLSAETHGLVTADDLSRMKPTALLVNTSRAQVIQSGALVTALQDGRPGFAAVDVYEDEPVLGANHPLIGMKNALCTPHLGYVERDSYEALFGAAVDQILAFAAGRPINVANPEVLKARRPG